MIIKEELGFRVKHVSELDDEKYVDYYFPNELLDIWDSLIDNNLLVMRPLGLNGFIVDGEFLMKDGLVEISLIFWDVLIEDNHDPDIFESFKKYRDYNLNVLVNILENYFSDYLGSEVKRFLVEYDGIKVSFPLDPEYARHFMSFTMPDAFSREEYKTGISPSYFFNDNVFSFPYQKEFRFPHIFPCFYGPSNLFLNTEKYPIPNEKRKAKYQKWKSEIIERDKKCQKCGSYKNLEAHHINNYYRFPELRYGLDNGVTLCRKCHRKYHSIYGKNKANSIDFDKFMKL